MRFTLLRAGTLMAMTLAGAGSALAFTFENPGQTPGSSDPKAPIQFGGSDPSSVLPPIGEPVPGLRFDHGPSSNNNGLAMPPDPRNSIGPSWLYGSR